MLVEQAGDVRSFLDGKQMRPILFFAEKPQVGYEAIPLAKKYGVTIAISQFRSIVMRAGTDPKQVTAMSAALEKVAARRRLHEVPRGRARLRRQLHPGGARPAPFSPRELKLDRAERCRRSREPRRRRSRRRRRRAHEGTLRLALPHTVMLLVAVLLYWAATRIDRRRRAGGSGRMSGRRLIIVHGGCCASTRSCKRLVIGASSRRRRTDRGTRSPPATSRCRDRSCRRASVDTPQARCAASALIAGYVVGVPWIGFFVATALFLALFPWIGGYRRALPVALASACSARSFCW